MSLGQSLRYIYRHPLGGFGGLGRFARWQVMSRIYSNRIGLIPWVNGSVLAVKRGEHGLTGNIYCVLHESEEMQFFLAVLRSTDFFIDVGANGGSFSILAAKVRGCQGLAFEPAPGNYQLLRRNLKANSIESQVEARQAAVSDYVGVGNMSSPSGATSQLITGDSSSHGDQQIAVTTLDSLKTPTADVLIKVDVEGAEERVIGGANGFLRNERILAVTMEVHWEEKELSPNSQRVLRRMEELGFESFHYEPRAGSLAKGTSPDHRNVIFTRRPNEVNARTQVEFAISANTSGPWAFVNESDLPEREYT